MTTKSKIPLLIYTHSDCSFIWSSLVGQISQYVRDVEIHFAYNDTIDDIEKYDIPESWIRHTYVDNIVWTKRINSILKEIDCEYLLFIHEDWIPTAPVSGKILDEMYNFMSENSWDYLLSYAHYSVVESQDGIFTGHDDYYFYKEDSHIFQPAIWKKTVFEEFTNQLDKTKNQNEDQDCLSFMRSKNTYSVQNVKTVRQYRTTNSLIFPHMHALSEGLWNFTKYPTLKKLLDGYGIDTDSRGIHTWWELDTQ
jgi:hypothetical protein